MIGSLGDLGWIVKRSSSIQRWGRGGFRSAIYRRYAIVCAGDLVRAARQLDDAAGIVPGIVRTGTDRGASDDPGFPEENVAPGRTRTCDPRLLRNCSLKYFTSPTINEVEAKGCSALTEPA